METFPPGPDHPLKTTSDMGFRPLASGQGARTGRDRRSGEANERDVRPKAENAQLLDLLSCFGPEFCFSTRAKILSETRLNTPSPRYNEKTNVADKRNHEDRNAFCRDPQCAVAPRSNFFIRTNQQPDRRCLEAGHKCLDCLECGHQSEPRNE